MFISHYNYDICSDEKYPSINLKINLVNEYERAKIMRFASTGVGVHIISEGDYQILTHPSWKIRSLTDLKVTKVIYHNPATIVFWSDGTKTVVKCGKDDTYDKEKGFYIACAKKLFGNDYKAVGRMNKALEMAVTQTKLERMTMDDVLLSEEEK